MAMEDGPKISVLICTRNRAAQLEKALVFWKKINTNCLRELIIVDNGSTDSTHDVLQAFAKQVEFPVQVVYEGAPGLSKARNTGLDYVKGDVVTFTDDDCYPQKDYVAQISRVFDEYRSSGFLGGRVLLHDKTDLRTTIQERDSIVELGPRSVVKAGYMHGANFSVRRAVIENGLRFDERLGAGTKLMSAEDTDFMARVSWSGFKGLYHPAPVVFHHHGRKLPAEMAKLKKGYAIGRGAYYMKFIMRSESFKKYAKFWYYSFKREFSVERLHEVRGALNMLALMMVRRKPYRCNSKSLASKLT